MGRIFISEIDADSLEGVELDKLFPYLGLIINYPRVIVDNGKFYAYVFGNLKSDLPK